VNPDPASGPFTLGNPAATVPLSIVRDGGSPAVMAFGARFTLSGAYQVDAATPGDPCGASALTGTLMNLALSGTELGGIRRGRTGSAGCR
jgi:hypothetical protein